MAKHTAGKEARAFFTRLLIGALIGAGGVAPGVSGGSIAVMLGLYDRMTHLAVHPKEALRQWRFCTPLLLGIMAGAVTLGRALSALFVAAPMAARCLFIGLMAGTLPGVWRAAARDGFRSRYLVYAALGAAVGFWLLSGRGLPTLPEPSVPALLLCGAVVGLGAVVPGVSSSFILLSMDAYGYWLSAISGARPDFLPPLLAGAFITIALTVKLVDFLYRRAYSAFSFAVLGFLIASFVPVFPVITPDRRGALALLPGVLSALLSFWLSCRLSKNEKMCAEDACVLTKPRETGILIGSK
ncbi:MAG: DUF368 domain-containing protein [Clostridia bacterium]|nr:DUF368 domain-containing protein [Clostridia bacterium]